MTRVEVTFPVTGGTLSDLITLADETLFKFLLPGDAFTYDLGVKPVVQAFTGEVSIWGAEVHARINRSHA